MLQLVEEYKKARQELISWIGLVPLEKREVICVGYWSVKDILAHLIGWAKYQNKVIDNLLQGKKTINISNVKEFNIKSVYKRRDWHWDKNYKEFLNETERLLSNYMHLPETMWNKPIWKGQKTTPKKLIEIEIYHYQGEHLEQIRHNISG